VIVEVGATGVVVVVLAVAVWVTTCVEVDTVAVTDVVEMTISDDRHEHT